MADILLVLVLSIDKLINKAFVPHNIAIEYHDVLGVHLPVSELNL